MSDRLARSILWTYRWLGWVAYPLVGGYIGWRAAKGKEDRRRRKERYGITRMPRPDGPLVWIHAASVGEMSAVSPLAEQIADLGVNVVLTTGTVTSARIARDRFSGNIIHQYVPLDLKPSVSRFLGHWKPDLAIIAESEIWPLTILELGARRVPQVLVNGRLSDRSFKAWTKRSWLAEALLENLALVMAQSDVDGERYRSLGARPVIVTGNLKVDTQAPTVDLGELERLTEQVAGRRTWVAVSTHDGEEVICAEVHRTLKRRHPDLLTIIVPRHPTRGDDVESALGAMNLAVARRSRGDRITAETDILLGDTIGEMGLYLRLADIAFVGKSLTGEGGQNPLEPAMLDCAILSGKNVQNFRESYQRLIKNGGAKLVKDKEMLAGAVNYLFNNEAVRVSMKQNAVQTVESMRGALARTMRGLEPFIHPLVVEARLDRGKKGDDA
ncbi:3-deoxy-D-manno-octulosonic acid transferase [Zhengella mangrovi]|uniref:3-deoxy-D-manno-octulosonic acid transferase n=1 Tax=Zhengella mangrovi TaxID=1982044 RepID=A0A2G1QL07_9HYPH|nr:lipid IV(A) 3-deoxy-D-manno-octulosonic acid transferase [Zhengella mangrovi]PHP66206.1 3-deoxy-D-manno-octulosonic acid transferase [Zhengella mangrovi]